MIFDQLLSLSLFDPGSPVDASLFFILLAFVSVSYYLILYVYVLFYQNNAKVCQFIHDASTFSQQQISRSIKLRVLSYVFAAFIPFLHKIMMDTNKIKPFVLL